jgi:hypothetical protein
LSSQIDTSISVTPHGPSTPSLDASFCDRQIVIPK